MRRAAVLLAAAMALAASCFRPPIERSIRIAFADGPGLVVSDRTRIETPVGHGGNAALEARIESERDRLLSRDDAWSREIERLRPASETIRLELEDGDLWEAERTARFGNERVIEPLFLALEATAFLEDDGATRTLAVHPGSPRRADRRQRRLVEETIDRWSTSVADYLARVADLWAYLERNPDRATVCLTEIFEGVLDEEARAAIPDPDPSEEERLEALEEAMEAVADVLTVPAGEAHTLDEVSRIVFDPFPADVRVAVPVEPDEVEGFLRGAGGDLEVARLGLWEALSRLEDRWISPDPLLALVRAIDAGDEESFDLESFVAIPRRAADTPDADEVESEIRGELSGPAVYRVTWTVTRSPRQPRRRGGEVRRRRRSRPSAA